METEVIREHRNVEAGQIVMPFYLGVDTSWSMDDDIVALNRGLRGLLGAIVSEPVVDDVARVSIVSFSSQAQVVVPLGQGSEASVPELSAGGGTNYGAAFELLASQIERDRQELKGKGHKIFRPVVFFLTDGEPQDADWARTFKEKLTYDKATGVGNPSHPIFIPFGFRDAPEAVMRQLAYPPERGRWYLARTSSVEDALKGVLDVIMNTVIATSQTAHGAKPSVQLAKPAPGSAIVSGASDYDDDYLN